MSTLRRHGKTQWNYVTARAMYDGLYTSTSMHEAQVAEEPSVSSVSPAAPKTENISFSSSCHTLLHFTVLCFDVLCFTVGCGDVM